MLNFTFLNSREFQASLGLNYFKWPESWPFPFSPQNLQNAKNAFQGFQDKKKFATM